MRKIILLLCLVSTLGKCMAQEFTRVDYIKNLYSEGVLNTDEASILILANASSDSISGSLVDEILADIMPTSKVQLKSIDIKGLILGVVSWIGNKLIGGGMSTKECMDMVQEVIDLRCRAESEIVELKIKK